MTADRRLLRLVAFKEMRKGGLIGFATVEITPPGLIVVDCPLRVNGVGAYWCALPVLKWRDRDRGDRFSARVVELVRQQYPGALP